LYVIETERHHPAGYTSHVHQAQVSVFPVNSQSSYNKSSTPWRCE
jgi:hypothetical protein